LVTSTSYVVAVNIMAFTNITPENYTALRELIPTSVKETWYTDMLHCS